MHAFDVLGDAVRLRNLELLADGDDPDTARATAERTAGFYTGAEEG